MKVKKEDKVLLILVKIVNIEIKLIMIKLIEDNIVLLILVKKNKYSKINLIKVLNVVKYNLIVVMNLIIVEILLKCKQMFKIKILWPRINKKFKEMVVKILKIVLFLIIEVSLKWKETMNKLWIKMINHLIVKNFKDKIIELEIIKIPQNLIK